METLDMLEQCSAIRGNNTSVVSYILSPATKMEAARAFIQKELSTAANIKDKRNRLSVQDSLKAVLDVLTGYRATPDAGVAIFAGPCI
jgi:peptide subunit release factor 1 (eRF1)